MNWITVLGIILGALASAGGLYLVHLGNGRSANERNSELKEQLDLARKERKYSAQRLEAANHSLEAQSNNIKTLRDENMRLSNKILLQQKKDQDLISGVNSKLYAWYSMVKCGSDLCFSIVLQNPNNAPLYDVTIRYYEVNEYDAASVNGIATFESTKIEKRLQLGTIAPHYFTPITEYKLLKSEGEHYLIHVGTRSNIWLQEIFFEYNQNRNIIACYKLFIHNEKSQKWKLYQESKNDDFSLDFESLDWNIKE